MVYVCSFDGVTTGGTELLHQLVFMLNKHGIGAQISYVANSYPIQLTVTSVVERYSEYVSDAEADLSVIDRKGNVVVVPETMFDLFGQLENAKKVAWWLSVDNYISFVKKLYNFSDKDMTDLYNLDYYFFRERSDVLHLAQSYYAINFLENKIGIAKDYVTYLSDYINDIYFEKDAQLSQERDNVILYNPAKGGEKMKAIVESLPMFSWVALQGFTKEEMRYQMEHAKVYVDFGEHPGKDRIPREAGICGCCVITGRQGAAANDKDVPIPMRYKLDDTQDIDLNTFKEVVQDIFDNFNERSSEYDFYRKMIAAEKEQFEKDVKRIFDFEKD